MKRGGPLPRRTPLNPGKPLAGGGELRRVAPMRQTAPAKPAKRRTPPPPVPPAVRAMVIARATDEAGTVLCDRCGKPITGQVSVHHRDPRGMGGSRNSDPHHPARLVLLGGSGVSDCHGRVEAHRTEAYAQGFLVRGSAVRAEDVPIFRHLRSWVIPGDGVWIPAEEPMAA